MSSAAAQRNVLDWRAGPGSSPNITLAMETNMLARTNRLLAMNLGLVAILLAALAENVGALGFDDFGDGRLSPFNYRDWPGIMLVITHQPRVYHQWVNGNEHFCYRGGTEVLNEALTKYAAVQAAAREVVLLPGLGRMGTLRQKSIEYDWHLHIRGGLSRAIAAEDKGFFVCPPYPTVWVFVGGGMDLDKLRVPKGIGIIGLPDLRRRYMRAITSESKQVRGYAAYHLAQVDFDSKESAAAIGRLLSDNDNWVRTMAASALGQFGRHAESAVPLLQRGLHDPKESIRKAFKQAIGNIETARDRPEATRRRAEDLAAIGRYCKSWEMAAGLLNAQ